MLDFRKLKGAYDELVPVINKYRFRELRRTFYEDRFYDLLREKTKLTIYRSFWIGNHNVDIFIPFITNAQILAKDVEKTKFKGLAIEIDGPVHDEYEKMQRDGSKYLSLHNLNIALAVIENGNLEGSLARRIVSEVPRLDRLDTRGRRRLLSKIHLKTILSHQSLIFKEDLPKGMEILRILASKELVK